jgi:hypothetical protein
LWSLYSSFGFVFSLWVSGGWCTGGYTNTGNFNDLHPWVLEFFFCVLRDFLLPLALRTLAYLKNLTFPFAPQEILMSYILGFWRLLYTL